MWYSKRHSIIPTRHVQSGHTQDANQSQNEQLNTQKRAPPVPGRQGSRRFESAMLHPPVLNSDLAVGAAECQLWAHFDRLLAGKGSRPIRGAALNAARESFAGSRSSVRRELELHALAVRPPQGDTSCRQYDLPRRVSWALAGVVHGGTQKALNEVPQPRPRDFAAVGRSSTATHTERPETRSAQIVDRSRRTAR